MKNKISIIVGGSGQFGITIEKNLLKKKHSVVITTRNPYEAKKKIKIENKRLKIVKLNILSKMESFSSADVFKFQKQVTHMHLSHQHPAAAAAAESFSFDLHIPILAHKAESY